MKTRSLQHSISGVFVFLLLGIFAVFSTVMVLLGAKIYREAVQATSDHNTMRISSAYLRSMLRGDDEEGVIALETVDGIDTVVLRNIYDEEEYDTRIFVYGGSLREWFSSAEERFAPEDGETLCPADEMTAVLQDGLLSARIRTGDDWTEVVYAVRSGH